MNILVDLARKLGIIPAPQVDTVSSVMRARAIIEANRLGVFELHAFNPEQARQIFKKVAAALAPGGVFVVLDHLRGVSRGRDSVVALMGLNWLTLGGRSYNLDEVKGLMAEAGFSRSSVQKLPFQVGATAATGSC